MSVSISWNGGAYSLWVTVKQLGYSTTLAVSTWDDILPALERAVGNPRGLPLTKWEPTGNSPQAKDYRAEKARIESAKKKS